MYVYSVLNDVWWLLLLFACKGFWFLINFSIPSLSTLLIKGIDINI